ncbi:uncharacterized protein [Narcine bancroftii]|uniref:uncharacterized protein n=1 Tax=Narcine bancroftii TaxID=1343680 RepID=UPI0038322309
MNRNTFFLSIIDEYSHYPFTTPCPDTSTSSVIKALNSIFILFEYSSYIHSDWGSSFMSKYLHQYLQVRGIASSRTTSYNPRENGKVEKENTTIWKAVKLALKCRGLPDSRWQDVLPMVLHSIWSLLCTVTNLTPHKLFLNFEQRSSSGTTLPTWLTPGPVLLRKWRSKTDTLVERVRLLHANPTYAYMEYLDDREVTIFIRDLAPTRVHCLR